MSKRIAVLCSGGGTNLQALIDAVEAGTIDGQIVLVLANASKAFALERAKKHGIPAEFVRWFPIRRLSIRSFGKTSGLRTSKSIPRLCLFKVLPNRIP